MNPKTVLHERAGDLASGASAITLRFSDGVEQSLTVKSGEAILDVALAAGVPILNQCRSGSCTSCTARLIEGSAPMRPGGGCALSRSEREEGLRLLCQTEAESNCTFEIDYDSNIGGTATVKGHAFVDTVQQLAPDVVRLQLELADGFWLSFLPGQYVQVQVPGTHESRSYSIASSPDQLPKIELLIRLLPGGLMSEWLTEKASADDVIELEGPYGNFFLRDKVRAPHILVAGGTGLAPMMSIIDVLRAKPGRKPDILLSFGCTRGDRLFHQDALELRQLWLPTLEVRVSAEIGPVDLGVLIGNPVQAVVGEDISDVDTVAYLCGPPGMIHAARTHLEKLGIKQENIFAEQFVASGE